MTYTEAYSKIKNFVSTEKRSVYLVQAPDKSGRDAYYFVMVIPKMEKAFVDAVQSGPTYLENFGTIVFSGFGDVVPPAVKKFMTKRYGLTISHAA